MAGPSRPGMRSQAAGTQLIDALLDSAPQTELGLAVSHDSVVMPYIAHHTGHDFASGWLAPLDGVDLKATEVIWKGRRFPWRS